MSKVAKFDQEEEAAPQLELSEEILKKLEPLNAALDKHASDQTEEILKLDLKYFHLKKPLMDQRNAILAEIPDFWLTVLRNNETTAGLVATEQDEQVLSHLKKISYTFGEDVVRGFELTFTFEDNEFFKASVLTKKFTVDPETGDVTISAPTVAWKAGKSLAPLSGEAESNSKKRKAENEDVSNPSEFFSFLLAVNDDVMPVYGAGEAIKTILEDNPVELYLHPEAGFDDDEGEFFDDGEGDGEGDEGEDEGEDGGDDQE